MLLYGGADCVSFVDFFVCKVCVLIGSFFISICCIVILRVSFNRTISVCLSGVSKSR